MFLAPQRLYYKKEIRSVFVAQSIKYVSINVSKKYVLY